MEAPSKQLPTLITPQQFERLLPLAVAWALEQEHAILQSGVALSEELKTDAKNLGVTRPEQVRLLRVPWIPVPSHPVLAAAASALGLVSSNLPGMTLRYGIYIRYDCWGNRPIVAHELVHTAQYERFGSIEAFLRPYLLECINPPGYPHGSLELEAASKAAKLFA